MCSGGGKSAAKPPVKRGYPGDTSLAQHKHDLGSQLLKKPRANLTWTETLETDDPEGADNGLARYARSKDPGQLEASSRAELRQPNRTHDISGSVPTWKVNQPPPSNGPEKVHYSMLWKVANPKKRTTRIAHNYSTSNTRGMMPRLTFPHVVLARELGSSCASLPDSQAAHRQMGFVVERPALSGPAAILCTSPACPEFI